jgi:hypothetical protein
MFESILKTLKGIPPLELAILAIFIVYIALPLKTPEGIANLVDSPLGVILLLISTIYLFVYTSNPLLGVIFILVAYELIRRSSQSSSVRYIELTPSQRQKDIQMVAMNPPKQTSLEEEIVEMRAPIGQSNIIQKPTAGNFKPVADKLIDGASML